MDTRAISNEITEIRERLTEMSEIREQLPQDAFAEKTVLLDEEHQLEARLADLREKAARAGAGLATANAAALTDMTRTPKLPAK